MATSILPNLKCFDEETHVWFPSHEWTRGLCSRCGRKQPGISDEARQEMADQDADRKRYYEFRRDNGPFASTNQARRAYDHALAGEVSE